MIINDKKYSRVKQFIENQYENNQDWEKVRTLSMFSNNMSISEILSQIVCPLTGLESKLLSEQIWTHLVDTIEKRDKEIHVVKLGATIKSDATLPVDGYSSWQLYKKKLENQNWSEQSINNIKKTSFEILQNLSMNTLEEGPVKGLVIGNVQSGKTANMAGLMAMAADNGFNYFIILSGVIENLRQQTSTRLYNDMNSSGHGNLHWHQVDKPSLRSKLPEHDISKFNLGANDKDRYFTVSLKNKGRLNSLVSWLFSDVNKAKQLKVLIIDDEADQASINTNDIEEEDSTAINSCIKKIVNTEKVRGMNYIAYTATPYANVLNEVSSESLYPKDFIVILEPSEDYIGPKQLFGTELPEMSPFIDIIKEISDGDEARVKEIQKGNLSQSLPSSFINAIHWFILTIGAMRAIDYHKPITMLIHTSFKISHHENVAKKVNEYLSNMKKNYRQTVPQLKEMYQNESLDFKRSYFLDGLKNYSTPEEVPDYPEWEIIEKYIDRLFRLNEEEFLSHINIGEEGEPSYHKGIHLAIDNSQSKADNQIMRLVYPTKKQMPNVAPAFIVIGGNTLSRGLTLEGLTTTYFLRTTNQADTLMQMGRWFGYRKGYEVFPRVWLDRLALERFQFLSQMNEELRDEIGMYAESKLTPIEYAPRIKNSSNYKLIRITSNNKMQAAEAREYDFSGFNTQTIYFENNKEKLKSNLDLAQQFLNSLESPDVQRNHLIWRDVNINDIKKFLELYEVCESDTKMSSLPALIEWAEKNSKHLSKWSVIHSSIGNVAETKSEIGGWNIKGFNPKTVKRTKLKNRSDGKLVSIGALRTPSDLLADIDAELTTVEKKAAKPSQVQAIREKYGYGKVPQLIIYRIDKDDRSEEEYTRENPTKHNRLPLNFLEDVIGINIMIPGDTKGNNMTTYISAAIDVDQQNVQESYFEEENENK